LYNKGRIKERTRTVTQEARTTVLCGKHVPADKLLHHLATCKRCAAISKARLSRFAKKGSPEEKLLGAIFGEEGASAVEGP
jgi:hypothetical protein